MHGHSTLNLPLYNCDLNPIELAWSAVKYFIRENNVTAEFSLSRLSSLTSDGISSVTAENWAGYYRHVRKIEDDYWAKDPVVFDVIDQIIISNPILYRPTLWINQECIVHNVYIHIYMKI